MLSKIYDIDAQDISNIDKNAVFALDTNILFWTHYSQASNPKLKSHPYQVSKYPDFIDKLLENGNTLVTTSFNLTELINLVEDSEYKIYRAINNSNISKKDFRKIKTEREKCKKEIETILFQIKSSYAAQIKFIDITDEDIKEFVKNMYDTSCDIFDYFIVEYLKKINITNFVTDDRDFQNIEGINVYCAHC